MNTSPNRAALDWQFIAKALAEALEAEHGPIHPESLPECKACAALIEYYETLALLPPQSIPVPQAIGRIIRFEPTHPGPRPRCHCGAELQSSLCPYCDEA